MLEKRTVLDQRTIDANGTIHLRYRKEVVEDGKVLAFEYHRTCIEPGADPEYVMNAVDTNLTEMKCATLDSDSKDLIRRTVEAEHTPEVVTAHREKILSAEAAMIAELEAVK